MRTMGEAQYPQSYLMVQPPVWNDIPKKCPRVLLKETLQPTIICSETTLKSAQWHCDTIYHERIKISPIIITSHGTQARSHRKSLDDPCLRTPVVTILQTPSSCTSISHSVQAHNIVTVAK